MRTVSIFIASSIVEFEYERIYIGDFIRKLNDEFKALSVRVRLYMCEDEYINSQSFYDRLIESSDIFILIVGEGLGEFSRHELVEVADKCEYIKKKIIILNSEDSYKYIPENLMSSFEIRLLPTSNSKKDELQTLISDLVEDLAASKKDEDQLLITGEFIINLPKADDIEVAVLNNIIRRLNDQDYSIIVHDASFDGSENAYVGLLSKTLTSEGQRIFEILSKSLSAETLWVFADECFNAKSLPNSIENQENCEQVVSKLINAYNNYPSFYSDLKTLAHLFEIRIRRALHTAQIAEKAAERAAFIYIVEDHWLIQKSLITGRKTLKFNLWDLTNSISYEKAVRKERVIANLLNIYWLSGQWDKHIDAWSKLNQKKFDEIIYTVEDLNEIKAKDYGQALYDYICDTIENIQKHAIDMGSEWLKREISSLHLVIKNGHTLSNSQKIVSLIYLADAYSAYDDTIQNALDLYDEALDFDEIEFRNILKTQIGSLVYIGGRMIDNGQIDLLQRICSLGLKTTDETDVYYWTIFKLFECVSLQLRGLEWSKQLNCITSRITPEIVCSDNSIAEAYILAQILKVQFTATQNQGDILILSDQINEIYLLYTKYLAFDPHKYGYIGIALASFQSLVMCDILLAERLVDNFKNNEGENERSKFYCDLLFNTGIIYYRLGRYDESLKALSEVTELSKNDYDLGSAYQNIALCYMQKYKTRDALNDAEESYSIALSYYEKCKSTRMCGNVHDGLSFCYILQKNFKKAEEEALKSISISTYTDDNKYCNYISSLLCQRKYFKAFRIFHSHNNKPQLYKMLQKDWNDEIKEVGIDIKRFRLFKTFIFFRRTI